MRLELPDELLPYVVEHGSIAIEGVSLTVAALRDDPVVEVSLIPETLERTTLGRLGTVTGSTSSATSSLATSAASLRPIRACHPLCEVSSEAIAEEEPVSESE